MLQFKEENGFPISVRSVSHKVKYIAGELSRELNRLQGVYEAEESKNDKKAEAIEEFKSGLNSKLIEISKRIWDLGETRSMSLEESLAILKNQDKAYTSLMREKMNEWMVNKGEYSNQRNSNSMTGYRAVLGGFLEGSTLDFASIFTNSEMSRPKNLEKLLNTNQPSYWTIAFPNMKRRWTGTKLVDIYNEKGFIERLKARVEALQEEGAQLEFRDVYRKFAEEIYTEELSVVFAEIDNNLKPTSEIARLKENTQIAVQNLIERDGNVERFKELYQETQV